MKKLAWIMFLGMSSVSAAVHSVTSTANSGVGSLRQAIIEVNADATTPRVIEFAINSGVQTIIPLSELPHLTASDVLINGQSQPGWSAGNPQIVIDGSLLSQFELSAITIDGARNCVIQDLVINNGFFSGISLLNGASNNAIYGCFIGVDHTGMIAMPNSINIYINANKDHRNDSNIIGAPTKGNVIAGAIHYGIGILLAGNVSNTLIQANKIGTDKTGMRSIANAKAGIAVGALPIDMNLICSTTQIGGAGMGESNIISGNATTGIFMGFQTIVNTIIQGNFIGVDATGLNPLPNAINILELKSSISNTILGGLGIGENNIING